MTAISSFEYALHYLSTQDAYVLGPDFTAHIYTGLPHNNAIDVYVRTIEALEKITKNFKEADWETKDEQFLGDAHAKRTVATGGVSLTVSCTHLSRHVWLATRQPITYQDTTVYAMSPEALFLIKWNTVAWQNRPRPETEDDRTVLTTLRQRIDINKLRTILEYVPETYWRDGTI